VVREITPAELAERLARGEPTRLVDVRQPWEHEIAALAGSVLLPLDRLAYGEVELDPPPAEGELVVVYCHHGVRSLTGAALLHRAGVHGAVSLAGGIDAWSVEEDPSLPRY